MPRLLVIDDEPGIVAFVSRALNSRGYDVDTSTSPLKGLDVARRGEHDLVILDLLMDEAPGVEVLRRLREVVPDQPVLVLSALSDIDTKVLCLEIGAADYLTKPFSTDELVARVRAQLRRGDSAPGEDVVRQGALSVDRRRLTADIGDGPVDLSAREFLLLQRLMSAPERVWSREELLRRVWGVRFDPGGDAVASCVAEVRWKLGARVVETVGGAGYRLGDV
jgi:two-component system, OmpR family, response regulator